MAEKQASNQQMDSRLAWYQEAKFGLFLHWGAYSVAGVEASWSMMTPELSKVLFQNKTTVPAEEYTALPARFNPQKFDPAAWVRSAKAAGMRYIVITTKHHDGFCMFDAPGTDYKITNTPYGKDICLELAQACHQAGMRLGFYYSPPDMHHPGYRDPRKPVTKNWTGEPNRKEWADYLDYMESHVRKLLTGYGHVSILWFDGLTNTTKYNPERFHRFVKELSPDTLVNDRLGDGYDFITPEQFFPTKGIPARTGKPPANVDPGGDSLFRLVSSLFNTPGIRGWLRKQLVRYGNGTLELTPVHQELYPSPENFQPWETCMTMGSTWAYNPNEPAWKAPDLLVRNLVEVASRGGNYLLNIGPTALGEFPPEATERLGFIGNWMEQNGEAIYGTTYTPLNGCGWGRATRKGNQLYLHILEQPDNGRLVIDPFPGRALKVRWLAGGDLNFQQLGDKLEIQLPAPGQSDTIMVLAVDIDPTEAGWNTHSKPVVLTVPPHQYLKKQAISSAVINLVLNGLIALSSYAGRTSVPYPDAAVDVLITVFIITFLTAWLVVGAARTEYLKGNLERLKTARKLPRLPRGAGMRGLVIGLACTVIFGGLVLDGLAYLISPLEFNNWVYVIFKTLYTGASGALGASLAIQSVIDDHRS